MWVIVFQLGPTEHSLNYVQKNHKEYPKYCIYWVGPLLPEMFTADVETMKRLLQRPDGIKILKIKNIIKF